MGEMFARRYELLDPVADGGMGSVWLVRDHLDGDVKAAKVLRHSDAGSLLRFIREQSTRIHHRNVVTPLSWVGEDDAVLFTMPLVRGGSVATLVGDWGALPEMWVVTILEQTLDALGAVHEARVVHRDVKPANLLLEPTGSGVPHVRLTDFGIAAPIDQPRMTVSTAVVGTPGYMAPEQRAGADPDPRQDIFAVGVVGLEMLIGHPPPFAPSEHPATPLGRLLVRAASPQPERRPPTVAALSAELAQVRAGLPDAWDPGSVEVLDQFAADLPASVPCPPTVVLESRDHPDEQSAPDRPAPDRPVPSLAAVIGLAGLGVALLVAAVVILLLG